MCGRCFARSLKSSNHVTLKRSLSFLFCKLRLRSPRYFTCLLLGIIESMDGTFFVTGKLSASYLRCTSVARMCASRRRWEGRRMGGIPVRPAPFFYLLWTMNLCRNGVSGRIISSMQETGLTRQPSCLTTPRTPDAAT